MRATNSFGKADILELVALGVSLHAVYRIWGSAIAELVGGGVLLALAAVQLTRKE